MAPLPKRKHTRARQGKRRRALSVRASAYEKCPQCGNLKKLHTICPSCGYYKGRLVILKKERKGKNRTKKES